MRLMHFIHTPRHSGAEVLVYNLCKQHRAWGHECAIASFGPPQQEFIRFARDLEQQGVQLFFAEKPQKKFNRIRHYRKALRSFQADIIFAHSELPSLYGRVARSHSKVSAKFVSVMHSEKNFPSGLMAWAECSTGFLLDYLVFVSKKAKEDYLIRYGYRVPTAIIENGVEVNSYLRINRDSARRGLGLNRDDHMALQVGRIADIKQQLWTISVLEPLLKSGYLKLWFAGLTEEKNYEIKIRELINKKNLQGMVEFLGSRSDIPELLAAADVYFMPSRREAQSIAMLEALASGVPIFAADIPAFQFTKKFEGVYLFNTASQEISVDFLKKVISSKDRFLRDLSSYSIEGTSNAYLSIARDVLNSRP